MACVLEGVKDMITDNDHRAGLCLCLRCSCGKHVCPFKRKQSSVPRSVFKSSYKSSFRKHELRPLSVEPQQKYSKSQFPLESVTTSRKDFLPHPIEKPSNRSSSITKSLRSRIKYNSSYQDEYKQWSADYYESPKKVHIKHMPIVRKFTAFSTYSVYYDSKPIQKNKPILPKHNGNVVDLGYYESQVSTSRLDYPMKKFIPSSSLKAKDNSVSRFYYPGQFKSTSQESYRESNSEAPIRRARANIFSK